MFPTASDRGLMIGRVFLGLQTLEPATVPVNAFRNATAYAAGLAADLRAARAEIERLAADRRKRGRQIHELQQACARRNAMIDALERECNTLRFSYRYWRSAGFTWFRERANLIPLLETARRSAEAWRRVVLALTS